MIDRSLLDESSLEFVVVSDTHYMLAPGDRPVELESRRRQTARAGHALAVIASLKPSFVLHLGDLVQEFPASEDFDQALAEALTQLNHCGVRIHHVAGNHDVGDKPDPTMPTPWVTEESLAHYHDLVGPSWYSWDAGGYHFVVLNSQIMNGPLAAAEEQQSWCEADLAKSAGRPIIIALHLAPFLVDRTEPSLAHYDNIAEPARSWLLGLVEQYDVRLLLAGHSHFQFINRIGRTRFYVCPSTSFSRPGFSEVFSSLAPPERGRDDTAKLGFFLVRLQQDGPRVHLIRTWGREGDPAADKRQYVVSRLPIDLPDSPLGVVSVHPIAPTGEVPVAWPSMVRQPVRNDYPALACLELGARHLRIPISDLTNPAQSQRLEFLRDEGVQLTATWIWSPQHNLAELLGDRAELLDALEVQVPGDIRPDPTILRDLAGLIPGAIALAPLLPGEVVPGKQHARPRIGYRVDELPELDAHLEQNDVILDRALVRVDPDRSPWDVMAQAHTAEHLGQVQHIDWLVELTTLDDHEQAARVAEALLAAALHPGCRLFFSPLMDLDRTMDISNGLIDRHSNPRPAFNVARVLNSLLFGGGKEFHPCANPPEWDGISCRWLESENHHYCLIIPNRGQPCRIDITEAVPRVRFVRWYELEDGMRRDECLGDGGATADVLIERQPLLIVFDAGGDGSAGE